MVIVAGDWLECGVDRKQRVGGTAEVAVPFYEQEVLVGKAERECGSCVRLFLGGYRPGDRAAAIGEIVNCRTSLLSSFELRPGMDISDIRWLTDEYKSRSGHSASRFANDRAAKHLSLDGGHVCIEIEVYGALKLNGLERHHSRGGDQEIAGTADDGIDRRPEVDGTKLWACAFQGRKTGDLRGSGLLEIQPWEGGPGLGFPVQFLEWFEGDFAGLLFKERPMKLISTGQVVDRLALDRANEDEEQSGVKQTHFYDSAETG